VDVLPRSFPHTGFLYDLAVVGAGLAGSELAYAAARAGLDVLLVTQSLDSVGNLYHATVQGGFPEGTLLETARVQAGANSTHGADIWALHRAVKFLLEATPGIHLLQSLVVGLEPSPDGIRLETWEGVPRSAKRVLLAVGSFLMGRLIIGNTEEHAGRLSEVAYDDLYQNLLAQGLEFDTLEQTAPTLEGALPYSVRFKTFKPEELEGFKLRRLESVYALGRCIGGEHTYSSVLMDAHKLLKELVTSPLKTDNR